MSQAGQRPKAVSPSKVSKPPRKRFFSFKRKRSSKLVIDGLPTPDKDTIHSEVSALAKSVAANRRKKWIVKYGIDIEQDGKLVSDEERRKAGKSQRQARFEDDGSGSLRRGHGMSGERGMLRARISDGKAMDSRISCHQF